MRPVIDMLRETVELYPLLVGCRDGCDPVNDEGACLSSQIEFVLAHGPGYEQPEPVHVHALQPGLVTEWEYARDRGARRGSRYRSALRILWWCPCGFSEEAPAP